MAAGLLVYFVLLVVMTPMYARRLADVSARVNVGALQTLPSLLDLSEYQSMIQQNPIFGVQKQDKPAPVRSACDTFKQKYKMRRCSIAKPASRRILLYREMSLIALRF
jgi:hypothetical protein